ncbi:type 1 glutamine amidotransferase domain-containing protein [Enterobacter sichuanensis]|uniref:type 1 glutamine amidotransferase domain-containing protein n=1 Tax=Enterobacter sichuanensis TaxID=2071710 RepID=UPI003B978740
MFRPGTGLRILQEWNFLRIPSVLSKSTLQSMTLFTSQAVMPLCGTFPNNVGLQQITRDIHERGGVVSSVCHGYCGLLNTRLSNDELLVKGRRITGFSWTEEILAGVSREMPYNAQQEMKQRGARYEKAFLPFTPNVVVDGRLVTGQNPFSAKITAMRVVSLLNL